MTEFEARLSECLEALHEGRWDIAECLRRHPDHADALRPHLLAAVAVMRTYAASEPGAGFARSARERFLIASGQRLQEAFDVEPEPSFFAAARVRFLMAAQRMRLAETHQRGRLVPFVETHFRAMASAAAVLVLGLSFSTYTVASASNALPGDWQYPVKLQTERVRLALAFSEDARRDVQLDRVEERAREIEQLTRRGSVIGPGVLDRLVDHTQPLVDDASGDWATEDLARLQAVAAREQVALKLAKPQVDAGAEVQLAAAQDVSEKAVAASNEILSVRTDVPPRVVTPSVPLDQATPEPSEAASPDASSNPSSTSDLAATPTATATATPSGVRVGRTPEITREGITWIRLATGGFTTLIPSPADGWSIAGIGPGQGSSNAPSVLRLSNVNGTALITLNPRTGDMWWFVAHNGRFDEVQMRLKRDDGSIVVADRDYLRQVYGDAVTVPLYVLDNIEVAEPPTPTPEPSATPADPDPATQ